MSPGYINSLKDKLYALLRKFGIDRAVLWAILTRSWPIVTAPVSLLLIAFKFSPQLQGYYYTFYSIIGFQFLLDLGLSYIIIQFASHEWSKLSLNNLGEIIGEKEALLRLQSLARIFLRWYFIASIILTLALGIGGYLFFSRNNVNNIAWMWPWFSLCICNGLIFCLIPIWSLLEGCNQILKIYTYKFMQGIFLTLSFWTAVLLGAQLWAVIISNLVVLLSAGLFIKYKCKYFLKSLFPHNLSGACVKWQQEILPLLCRYGIGVLIGPVAYNLFVPVLFKYHGSVIAGQMGMTWALTNLVVSISASWLSPKVPQFGTLIAKNKYNELDKLFERTTIIILVVSSLGAAIAWAVVYVLNEIKNPLASRLLPIFPLTIFLLAQVILGMAAPFAAYLRAHKKEPLLYVVVGGGIAIMLSTLILGKRYSAIGMAMGYLAVNSIFLPIVIIIWYRCRKQWHKNVYVSDESLIMAQQ